MNLTTVASQLTLEVSVAIVRQVRQTRQIRVVERPTLLHAAQASLFLQAFLCHHYFLPQHLVVHHLPRPQTQLEQREPVYPILGVSQVVRLPALLLGRFSAPP